MWIWQAPDWPLFTHDAQAVAPPLAELGLAIGRLQGRTSVLDGDERDRMALSTLTADVLQSSAIEGERLDFDAVRSSLARRMGVAIETRGRPDRHVDGVVDMTLDANRNADAPLTADRLKGWQAALFPTGRSGLVEIATGQWRNDRAGPMQVVSGPIGKECVHFQAPPAERLDAEMARFLAWCERPTEEHPLLKAALAHLWFVTLHPFDDGNGRVARAIGDLMLSRAVGTEQRYFSVSSQILAERDAYYGILETTQKGGLDVTAWLQWFLACARRATQRADQELRKVLAKAMFWQRMRSVPLNERQVKALNKILDTFDKPVTNRKWAALTGVSSDTALRDLRALVENGAMVPTGGGGRSAAYWLTGVPLPGDSASEGP